VDLLAEHSPELESQQVSLDSALGLDVGLKDSPWYLPNRGNLEFAGQRGREGESYTWSRSVSFGLGTDIYLGSGAKTGVNRLSFDAVWERGLNYPYNVVSHSLSVDTGLDLLQGIKGQLTADHNLSITFEEQLAGGTPNQPDKTTVSSSLGLEYSWERQIDSKRQELLVASGLVAGSTARDVGRISHRDRLELENTLLGAKTEREELGDTTLVPIGLLFMHDTVMTVSELLDLKLSVKTIGGVEETISGGNSTYQPALGFELRLTAILNF
jgi:hypothetical protein